MSAELALPARLDLPAASPLAEALLALRGQDLCLSAEEVIHLGTPGLQVLLSAAKSWHADDRRLSIVSPSQAFTEQLAVLGFAPGDLSAPSGES